MNQSVELERVNNSAPVMIPVGPESPEAAPQAGSPLLIIKRLLQGRYHWAVLLGLLGLVLGGVGGFLLKPNIYRSVGIIRIKPNTSKIMYSTEDAGLMPMFDAFIASQIQLIESQRVLDMAMQSDEWKSFGYGFSPEARSDFGNNLDVQRAAKSEHITVAYESPRAQEAMTAVNMVIESYMRIFGERDALEESQRLRVLEDRRTALTNQLTSLRDRIYKIASEYGSDALESLYKHKLGQLNRIDQAITDTGVLLAAAGVTDTSAAATPEDVAKMTVDQIAALDPQMAQLMTQRVTFETDIQMNTLRYGENHPRVLDARKQLSVVQEMIEDYAAKYRESHSTGLALGQSNVGFAAQGMTTHQLMEKVRHLQTLFAQSQAETLDLGRKMLQINNLKAEAATTEQRLNETKFRIEQLNVESSVRGRIEVFSSGSQPILPINKGKRIQMAVVCGVAGGSVGLGFVLLLGAMDRRLKSSDDARHSTGQLRMLGVLPDLPDDLSDPKQATLAGGCVHHIRTLLQLGTNGDHHQVFTITGPAAGSGKTSLTLALGLSFAASGSKTLLVDCDLASGGLTSRLETSISRRIGEIFRRRGLITEQQLEEALWAADSSGKLLGETLVGMGALSDKDVAEALTMQQSTPIGLLDALAGEDLKSCITNAGLDKLDILPVGGAKAHDMSRMSPTVVRRVIDEARKYYDIIIQDTGPVPGGVETSIVAAEADGVVLVVSHGDEKSQVRSALTYLESIGAHIEGVVFNRANETDIAKSTFSTSQGYGTIVDNESGEIIETAVTLRSKRFDPVARSVVKQSQATPGSESPE